jgi:subtilisin-like proprotein convertase family protein
MTDPHGPPPAGWNQGGLDQGGWAAPGAAPQQAGGHPDAARYAETAHYQPPAQYQPPGQYQPPAQYQPPGQNAAGYGGYGDQQYGGQYGAAQYPSNPYAAQGGWPPAPGSGGPPPGRGKRMWIIIAAAVASVAIVAAVVVVVLLNRAPDPDTPIAQGVSAAAVPIPDNTPSGVTSPIDLEGGDATVGRLDVVLTLTHAYPGELTAVLTGPGGRQAVVFARAGTAGRLTLSTNDTTSPLRNLLGGPVAGTWSLTVSDEVSADTGTLDGWEISAYPAASDAPAPTPERATGTSTPGLEIPDADAFTGLTDRIELGGYGTADRIAVSVAISHDVSSDLLVELRSPLGRTVVLSDAEAALGPAIRLELDSSQPGSPLAALVGEPLAGPWQVRVYDRVAVDLGTLDSWEITVNG